MQRGFDYVQAKIPGWQPSEGQLDTMIIEAAGSEGADIATLTTEVPKTVFRYLGAVLFGIPPIDATSAVATSTWFLTDALGHTIPAGTQVGIADINGDLQPFEVLTDVVVPGGATQTAVGGVVLIASNAGILSSAIGSIGGEVQLLDVFSWVDHITQATISIGGQDAESDDTYLGRLSLNLQTMSPRPILPNDFAILAQNVAGVQRAAVLDGYNTGDGSFGNERMVTIISLDALGNAVSLATRNAISAYLESMRELNYVVHTTDPAIYAIDVTVNFTTTAGYSPTEVAGRVTDAIQNFLDPRYWGISDIDDPNDPKTWNNVTVIRYLELGTAINNVAGVDVVTLLTLGPHSGTLAAQDLVLTGLVPLPNLVTLVVVGS